MSYAIVGFGKIGQALAHAFARKNIEVTVASRRPPEVLAPLAQGIGPTVVAKSLRDALDAEVIILAILLANSRMCGILNLRSAGIWTERRHGHHTRHAPKGLLDPPRRSLDRLSG